MRNLTRWETLATCRDGDVNGHGLGGVVAGPGVSSARLLGAAVVQIGSQPDAVLAQLASSKKLRAVSFSSGAPTAEGYAVLASIPTIGGIDFAALSRLPQLRELSLTGLPRNAPVDLLVKHVPNLEVLHVESAVDACAAAIAQCAQLRELCIAACRCSAAGLQHLGQLSKLTALSLGEVREEGAAWDFLGRLTQLRAFTAPQANSAYVYGFDDAALQRIAT